KSLGGLLLQDSAVYAPDTTPVTLGTTTNPAGFIFIPQDVISGFTGELNWITNFGGTLYCIRFTGDNVFFSSTDGLNWTQLGLFTDNGILSFVNGGSLFVAVGVGIIYTSSNAISWNQQTSPTGA